MNAVLVLDWRKKQQARAGVRLAIRKALNGLPEAYDRDAFMAAYDALYQHVYEAARAPSPRPPSGRRAAGGESV